MRSIQLQNDVDSPGDLAALEEYELSPSQPKLPGILRFFAISFVFLIPFESAIDLSGGNSSLTLTKVFGLGFFGVAAFNAPATCFAKPALPVWLFAGYLLISILRMLVSSEPVTANLGASLTVLQGIACMWLLSNCLKFDDVRAQVVRAMLVSTVCVAALSMLGINTESDIDLGGRDTIFGNDPNYMTYILCLGLIAAVDCVAVERGLSIWGLLSYSSIPLMLERIFATGSRGGAIAAGLGVFTCAFSHWGKGGRMKMLLVIVIIGMIGMGVFNSSELSQRRWLRVLQERNISGRDMIYSSCIDMISEKPVLGWGPANLSEIARRESRGRPIRDTHNDLLRALTECGILGGGLFGAALVGCGVCAFAGRRAVRGQIGVALVVATMAFGMSCTAHNRKSFWVSMAFACAVFEASRREPEWQVDLVEERGPEGES